jgi:hypothetical protein
MLEGRWKLVILFHLFGERKLRFLGSRARDSGYLTEDADPGVPWPCWHLAQRATPGDALEGDFRRSRDEAH